MKRITLWALPVLMIAAITANAFAQAPTPAPTQDPKWNDTKEYDDYKAVYDEKDNAKKAAGAEKFFVDHKTADPIALTNMYQMLYLSYARAGNWPKVIETYEKLGTMAPKLSDADKAQYLQIALLAATNSKNNAKSIEFANKILDANPNDFTALFTISSILAGTLPTAEPGKSAQITRTLEITNRAISQPKPAAYTDAQWAGIQPQLRETTCLMLLNQTKYAESIAECQAALKINPKDGYAWYLIGLSRKAELKPLIEKYTESLKKYNDNRTADQITVDELRAEYQGREKIASDKKDEAVDAFARSAALGGNAEAEARKELKNLLMGSPEELNKIIEEKKAQILGGN